jgi:hypothetical protein
MWFWVGCVKKGNSMLQCQLNCEQMRLLGLGTCIPKLHGSTNLEMSATRQVRTFLYIIYTKYSWGKFGVKMIRKKKCPLSKLNKLLLLFQMYSCCVAS